MKNLPTRPLALILTAGTLFLNTSAAYGSDTDDRIEASAKKSYVFKTYLKGDDIKTESKNGAVTLTGSVDQLSHRALAEDTVEGLPGVKSVDNQLIVRGDAPRERSDTWIGLKVKTALLFHRNVRATKTDVNVKDGVVILSGEASSLAQKELTGEYARDVEGVNEVKNEMTVASSAPSEPDMPVDKIDDASITAQVRSSLIAHRSTGGINTKVSTLNGVVTLTGVARNAAEKSLVTKLAGDVHGVVSVVNNMTVTVPVAKN